MRRTIKHFRFAVHWTMVLAVAASMAALFRFQYFDMDHRVDRWTGEPQEFYQGRWLGRADFETQLAQETEAIYRIRMH